MHHLCKINRLDFDTIIQHTQSLDNTQYLQTDNHNNQETATSKPQDTAISSLTIPPLAPELLPPRSTESSLATSRQQAYQTSAEPAVSENPAIRPSALSPTSHRQSLETLLPPFPSHRGPIVSNTTINIPPVSTISYPIYYGLLSWVYAL